MSDYDLPNGMDDLRLASKRRAPLLRGFPVIILTGDISAGTSRGITMRQCPHLNKPVKARAMAEAVQQLPPLVMQPPTMLENEGYFAKEHVDGETFLKGCRVHDAARLIRRRHDMRGKDTDPMGMRLKSSRGCFPWHWAPAFSNPGTVTVAIGGYGYGNPTIQGGG